MCTFTMVIGPLLSPSVCVGECGETRDNGTQRTVLVEMDLVVDDEILVPVTRVIRRQVWTGLG